MCSAGIKPGPVHCSQSKAFLCNCMIGPFERGWEWSWQRWVPGTRTLVWTRTLQWDSCWVSCLEQSLTSLPNDSFTTLSCINIPHIWGHGGAGLPAFWWCSGPDFLLQPSVCPACSLLLCFCTSAALVASSRNTPPMCEESCETGAGFREADKSIVQWDSCVCFGWI